MLTKKHQLSLTHWKRLWFWEGLGAGGKGDNRGWDAWMASLTLWTWVWVNSGSWWWTGRPGVLRFMGSQRVGHDWATELNWNFFQILYCFHSTCFPYIWKLCACLHIYVFYFSYFCLGYWAKRKEMIMWHPRKVCWHSLFLNVLILNNFLSKQNSHSTLHISSLWPQFSPTVSPYHWKKSFTIQLRHYIF